MVMGLRFTELITAALEGEEQVWIGCGSDIDDLTACEDDFVFDDAVTSHAILGREETQASAKEVTTNTHVPCLCVSKMG